MTTWLQREEGRQREKVEDSQHAGNEESSEPGPGSGQRQTWLLLSGPWDPRAPICFNYQLSEVEKVWLFCLPLLEKAAIMKMSLIMCDNGITVHTAFYMQ